MKKLQISTVKQASNELKELTNIFTIWGQSLYSGEIIGEAQSFYELGARTHNNMEVIGRVSHNNGDTIRDSFSLYNYAKKVLEKYSND